MSASHSFPSSLTHGPCHQSQAVMAALVNERGIEPGFSTVVFITYHFLFYLLPKVLPKAEHPFQRLQKRYIQMPKSGSYEYAFCLYGHVFWMSSGKCYCKGHSKKCYQKQFVSTECQKVQRVKEEIIFIGESLLEVLRFYFYTPYCLQCSGQSRVRNQKTFA